MARLSYLMLMSLDLYVADKDGKWGWGVPDEPVHRLVNEIMRPVGIYLYGRRMYEVLSAWETIPDDNPAYINDFAKIWRAADKIVFSRTLEAVSSERTRIDRNFSVETVRRMKAEASRDLTIAGPELAGEAFAAGLIDDCHLFLAPIIVGGGKRGLPDDVLLPLRLIEERRFDNMVYLHYQMAAKEDR